MKKGGFILEKDENDHFLLKHTDGHMMKVAKSGISPEVKRVIESFALGGQVQGYYGGGGVEAFREKAAEDNMPVAPEEKKKPEEQSQQMPAIQIGTTPRPNEIFQPMAEGGKVPVDTSGRQGVNLGFLNPQDPSPVPMSARFASVDERDRYVAQQRAQGVAPEQMAPQVAATQMRPQFENLAVDPGPQYSAPQMQQPQQPMMGDAVAGDLNRYDQQMQRGQKAEAQALAQQGQAQAQALTEQEAQYRDLMDRTQSNLAGIQAKMDSINTSIMNQEIDPRRAWNNRSTGSKILGIFGMLLSGVGAGMAKQENMAMKLLGKQIDDDIRSQELELGKKKTALDGYMKEYGNVKDAAQALRLDYMQMAEAQLKKIAAQSAGPIAQAKADQFAATWGLEKAKIATQLATTRATQQQQQMNIPGFSLAQGYRPSETEAKDTREMIGAYASASKTIDNLTTLLKTHGTEQLPTQAKRDMGMYMNSLKLDVKKASQLGNISASDYELLESMIPDATSWSSAFNPAAGSQMISTLEKFKESLANKLENSASARGYTPNAPLYNPRPKTTPQYRVGQK